MKTNKMSRNLEKEIERIIKFYSILDVNLTKEEFLKSLPIWSDDKKSLEILKSLGYVLRNSETKRSRIWGEKFKKLRRLRRFFSFIPFVDFVLLAGSVAIGNVHERSDFDVIIGTKNNRMFTARFVSAVLFSLMGVRRSKDHDKEESSDKICMNHFVTPESYTLSPPYNIYWEQLYRRLIPIYGNKDKIIEFFEKNNWADVRIEFNTDILYEKKNWLTQLIEFLLGGIVGNLFENILMKMQFYRISKGDDASSDKHSRLEYNKEELRFHVDISRIEKIVNHMNNKE